MDETEPPQIRDASCENDDCNCDPDDGQTHRTIDREYDSVNTEDGLIATITRRVKCLTCGDTSTVKTGPDGTTIDGAISPPWQ